MAGVCRGMYHRFRMSLDETITLARSHYHGGPPQDVPIPRQLGNVRVSREIGRGGTAVVYTGRDQLLKRTVAVKFLSGAVPDPSDPGFAEFLEGARAAAAIYRSGLTTIYEAGVVEGLPYVVMQYVDGPNVFQLLRHEPFSFNDAMSVIIEAIELTAALHEHGIVHRDIKPSNLLIDMDGHLFLTDFGLAHRRRNLSETRPVSWAGTPAYMAPEMFEGQVSPKTDVYALGITAYELLTGKPPFGGTVDEIREQHQRVEWATEALKAAGVKQELLDVLERATHKRVMFRYKSASQFARALRTACPELGTPMQMETWLLQRVNRWRNATAVSGEAPRVTEGVTLATASAPAAEGATLADHMSALRSLKKSLREGSTARERLMQTPMEVPKVMEPPQDPGPPPPLPIVEPEPPRDSTWRRIWKRIRSPFKS
jgi:serine/threonine protein kinase